MVIIESCTADEGPLVSKHRVLITMYHANFITTICLT